MSSVDEKFWEQIKGDAKRTVLCEPHRLPEILALVEDRRYDHITVLASQFCPEGQLLVIDDGAMEAGFRQTVQRLARSMYR